MGFTFVEPDLGAALHIGIKQPIDDKECTFDPSDFSKGDSKVMLTRMRGKLFQELAGRHDTSHHGGGAAQDIWPVGYNRAFPDFAANQPFQFHRNTARIKDIQTL